MKITTTMIIYMIIIARWCITIYKMQRHTIFKQLVTVEYVWQIVVPIVSRIEETV